MSEITVYSKPNCPFCVKAKDYLAENNIPFIEVDVTKNEESYQMIKERHGTVPQIYYNNEILVEGGWNGLKNISLDVLKNFL